MPRSHKQASLFGRSQLALVPFVLATARIGPVIFVEIAVEIALNWERRAWRARHEHVRITEARRRTAERRTIVKASGKVRSACLHSRGGQQTNCWLVLLLGTIAIAAPARTALAQLEIGLNFTGATNRAPNGSFSIPPDTMGAVSSQHIVELINGRYNVYRKSDGVLVESRTLRNFWSNAGVSSSLTSDVFDPRLVYDPAAERFYAVSMSTRRSANSAILVAVSNSADPTAGWTGFAFDADADDKTWADFPRLGFDRDGIYATANMLSLSTGFPAGVDIVVVPKADLLAPTPTAANATVFENELSLFEANLQPIVDYDNGPNPAPFVSVARTIFDGKASRVDLVGPIHSPTLSEVRQIQMQAYLPDLTAAQPEGVRGVESDNFAGELIRQNGILWGTQTISIDDRAAQRWFKIDEATNTLLQEGVIASPELEYYYGSIAVNPFGDVVIGFSGSGENQYISAYAVLGQTDENGITTFGEPLLLQEGVDTYRRVANDRNRWGDYSATVLDPDDPFTFWTFQEFVSDKNEWSVQITQLHVVPEPLDLLLGAQALLAFCSVVAVRSLRSRHRTCD